MNENRKYSYLFMISLAFFCSTHAAETNRNQWAQLVNPYLTKKEWKAISYGATIGGCIGLAAGMVAYNFDTYVPYTDECAILHTISRFGLIMTVYTYPCLLCGGASALLFSRLRN